MEVLMLGNEAIARGAYEAGVKVSAAYPGTPSTEISESLVKYPEVYAEWSPNEKVAMEVALGASVSGVRALVSMKHVGLNVASDPLYSAAYTGVNAGLVLVVADDPGIYSSQNEQDTRMIARAAQLPLLEPSDSQEAKDFVKFAFWLSEEYDTPVIVRTTTRLSHSQSKVILEEREEREDRDYTKNIEKYVMMPGFANKRHLYVEERNEKMAKEGSAFFLNRAEYYDREIGIITSGIPYQYVKEAMPEASVLKLGQINPLPKELILDFAKQVKKLYIIEELEPVIEEQVKAWGVEVSGKELFTKQGEYSAALIQKAIGKKPMEAAISEEVPRRPPILCSGCSHRSVYTILKKLKVHGCGDIGCYTLGVNAPLNVIDTTVCMGASISMLHGMEKARGKEYIKNWVAVIGDSTFWHTGINSLINMVYNKASATVVILDNSTTGMTGHQDHAGTGLTLLEEKTVPISIAEVCKALGIQNVKEINAFRLKELEEQIKKALERQEISVFVVKSPCIMLKKETYTFAYWIDSSRCTGCNQCINTGCPAIVRNNNKELLIDDSRCTRCGLCSQICRFGAIEKNGAEVFREEAAAGKQN